MRALNVKEGLGSLAGGLTLTLTQGVLGSEIPGLRLRRCLTVLTLFRLRRGLSGLPEVLSSSEGGLLTFGLRRGS